MNGIDLCKCLILKKEGFTEQFKYYVEYFKDKYNLNNPCGLVMMMDTDLETLLIDSGIEFQTVYSTDVEYDADNEIQNREEGDVIGYIKLFQDNLKFVLDIVVADNGCIMDEGYDFDSLKFA